MKKGVRDPDPDPDPLVKGTDPDPHINVMDPQHTSSKNSIHGSDLLHLDLMLLYADWT